jgi:2-polyprenyl-6-methoxyphenol hydroxylase-like FAD-dependent oxidoreductase
MTVPVAIVGAGPVGLALALGLARHGVRSTLIERNAGTSRYSKAPGVHVRTREILRRWGVEDRFVAAGLLENHLRLQRAGSGRGLLASVDFRELDAEADRPGILILEQGETERLLLDAVRETRLCDVRFGTEAVGLTMHADSVSLRLRTDEAYGTIRAGFVAGCDGAGSFVRRAVGLPFDGLTYSLRPMLADVEIAAAGDAQPWPRYSNTSSGLRFTLRLRPGVWRIISLAPTGSSAETDRVSDAEVRATTEELLGEAPAGIIWSSRFRIHLRSSPSFRAGRVLLAGDAAHVHSPVGGMGMNAGIHDADNLAWKLAAAIDGCDVDRLLDSYDVERRAVAVERVSRLTDMMTRTFILAPAFVRELGFFAFRRLMRARLVRRRILRSVTMIDLDYPASPLLDGRERSAGVRLPNPLLRRADGGTVRLYDLLPAGPVLLEVGEGTNVRPEAVAAVIRIGRNALTDPTGLVRGLLGGRDGWILVRPDSHVAWARTEIRGMEAAVRRALAL